MFINTTEKRIFFKKEQIDVFDSFGSFSNKKLYISFRKGFEQCLRIKQITLRD